MNKILVLACIAGVLTVSTDLYTRLSSLNSGSTRAQEADDGSNFLPGKKDVISNDIIGFFESYGGKGASAKTNGESQKPKKAKVQAPKVVEPWGDEGLKLGDHKYKLVAVFSDSGVAVAHLVKFNLKSGDSKVISANVGHSIGSAKVVVIQPSKLVIEMDDGTLNTLRVFNVPGEIG